MAINWFKYSSPASFYFLAGKMIPLFTIAAIILFAVGLYIGFFVAPTDFQQGEAYRIIFIHVPAAWMSMFIYLVLGFWSAVGLVLNTRLSSMMAQAISLQFTRFNPATSFSVNVSVLRAKSAGTPALSGSENVAPPDPAFTSRLSAWPW